MWTKLAPLSPTRMPNAPSISIKIGARVDGQRVAHLFLNKNLIDRLSNPEAVNISLGTDEHAGQIALSFSDAGAFKLRRLNYKGGGRCVFPLSPMPSFDTAPTPAPIETIDGQVVVLRVPTFVAKAPAKPKAPRKPAAEPVRLVSGGEVAVRKDGKIDPVEFLIERGKKVSRLANGRFSIDGDTVTAVEILGIVNRSRAILRQPNVSLSDLIL